MRVPRIRIMDLSLIFKGTPQGTMNLTTFLSMSLELQDLRVLCFLMPSDTERPGHRVIGAWVYGDLIIIYPKPYSIYLRGTVEG